jgi:hypothetical protein
MNTKSGSLLSRRQFTRRAALLSATASLVPTASLLPASGHAAAPQSPQNAPQLSPEGQLEVDSRYQQVLSLYGNRLDEAQKANIKKMCADLQPTLEKVRKFNLENGNAPALFLKPLVEREPKPQPTATSKKP